MQRVATETSRVTIRMHWRVPPLKEFLDEKALDYAAKLKLPHLRYTNRLRLKISQVRRVPTAQALSHYNYTIEIFHAHFGNRVRTYCEVKDRDAVV